jgi:sodium/proline symporter
VFRAIGISSSRRAAGTRKDYYIASQSISPALVGLSAVATNNSGYMFIGVIGYTYATGLPAIWLMLGWISGDFLASLFIHRRISTQTKTTGTLSFAGLLSTWNGTNFAVFCRVASIISIVFLGAYSAAQLAAGGKALHVLFGWPQAAGAIIGGVIVLVYCIAGGIRASIWTDAAQSVVMLAAMLVLFVTGIQGLGGIEGAWSKMEAIPGFTDWFPPDLLLPGVSGMLLFVLGWMFAGFSVVGQPHIMVRFMALDDPKNIVRARAYYYGFFTIFYFFANGVGMMSRIYLPNLQSLDPELALPTIALELLPPVAVGMILAGIFAATMSTADSLILSCSASLTHDLFPKIFHSTKMCKIGTLAVTLLALVIALNQTQSVFSLVILAWSVMASAFAPLLVVYALRGRPSEYQALAMMIIGVGTALLWRHFGLQDDIYEGMPGILAGLATFGIYEGIRRTLGAGSWSPEKEALKERSAE